MSSYLDQVFDVYDSIRNGVVFSHAVIESLMLEKTTKITQSNPSPPSPCPLPTSLSATSPDWTPPWTVTPSPPWAAVPLQHCSFGEEIVPNIQPEPPLAQCFTPSWKYVRTKEYVHAAAVQLRVGSFCKVNIHVTLPGFMSWGFSRMKAITEDSNLSKRLFLKHGVLFLAVFLWRWNAIP